MKNYLILFITLFFVGCFAATENVSSKILFNGKYQIISLVVDNVNLKVPENATFNVDDSRIYGNTGCNNYFTSFTRNNNTIKVFNSGSTKMMCQEKIVNNFEFKYLSNFEGDYNIYQDGNNLILEKSAMQLKLQKK